jgi:hypothetical protein
MAKEFTNLSNGRAIIQMKQSQEDFQIKIHTPENFVCRIYQCTLKQHASVDQILYFEGQGFPATLQWERLNSP